MYKQTFPFGYFAKDLKIRNTTRLATILAFVARAQQRSYSYSAGISVRTLFSGSVSERTGRTYVPHKPTKLISRHELR